MFNSIEQLKEDKENIHRITLDDGKSYGIRVLGRGETLFFQCDNRAFLCEIDARKGYINSKSIKKWDDNKLITSDEKEQIIDILLNLYKQFYNSNAKLF